ncbi:MAG: hypothetical protein WC979_02300 [Candidatus Pacearchaeota archaeon]|jgi:hypothetical protein|nr:hypothetical protein [Clostridia bacterium]
MMTIGNITYYIRSYITHKTIDAAEKWGLSFHRNIYGDEINHLNCRSLWKDSYGNFHKCKELYENK